MQRTLIGLTVLTVLVMGFVVAAQPRAPATKCTWKGNSGRDVKTGTPRRNVLCSVRGNDFIHGAAGNDLLKAGPGRDVAVGAEGRDVLKGGNGRDRLFAVDDQGGELVIGGRGVDQCFVDLGDQVRGCERTFRGLSLQEVNALEQVAFEVMEIIELEIPTITPIPTPTLPPPVVTITRTRTRTVTLPPCNEGPPDPPPFCGGR